jgi:hypothetical protein
MSRTVLIVLLLFCPPGLALGQQTGSDSERIAENAPKTGAKDRQALKTAGSERELADALLDAAAPGSPPPPGSVFTAARIVGFPAVLTSESPLVSVEQAKGTLDLAWLQRLNPPELPVRWDGRLVRLLEHYRTVPRGKALIRGLFKRAGRYGSMIRRKLRETGLPEDLLYVAMVESGSIRRYAPALGRSVCGR